MENDEMIIVERLIAMRNMLLANKGVDIPVLQSIIIDSEGAGSYVYGEKDRICEWTLSPSDTVIWQKWLGELGIQPLLPSNTRRQNTVILSDDPLVQRFLERCDALAALYDRKNHDYGDSFHKSFQEYGLTMVAIRLEDKLNRLKSLMKREAKVQDESLEDTLMDLANYAIMTLMELQDKKEKGVSASE